MGTTESKVKVDTSKADMDDQEKMLQEISAKIQKGNANMKEIMTKNGDDVYLEKLKLLNEMQDPALRMGLALTKEVKSLPQVHQKKVRQIIDDFKVLLFDTIKFCGDIEAHHQQEMSAIEKLKLIHEMGKVNSDADNARLIGEARKNFDEARSKALRLVGTSQNLINDYTNIRKQLTDEAEELKQLSGHKNFWQNMAIGCAVLGTLVVVGAGAAALTVATFGGAAPFIAVGTGMLVCGGVGGVTATVGAAAAAVASALDQTEDMAGILSEKVQALANQAGKAETSIQEIHRLLGRDETSGKKMVDALVCSDKEVLHLLSSKKYYDTFLDMEQNLEGILKTSRELSDTTAESLKMLARQK